MWGDCRERTEGDQNAHVATIKPDGEAWNGSPKQDSCYEPSGGEFLIEKKDELRGQAQQSLFIIGRVGHHP